MSYRLLLWFEAQICAGRLLCCTFPAALPLPEASSAAGIAEEDEEGNYLTLA